jgi:hypothetical protein
MRSGLGSRILLGTVLCLMACDPSASSTSPIDSVAPGSETSGITVCYGINESHSRDWAQLAGNGNVGIT